MNACLRKPVLVIYCKISYPKWVFLTYVGYSYMHKCLDNDIIIVILLLYAITMDFKLKNPLVIETQTFR